MFLLTVFNIERINLVIKYSFRQNVNTDKKGDLVRLTMLPTILPKKKILLEFT